MAIDSFSGEYRFLSNFWPVPSFVGLTVEHYFAAAKTEDPEERAKVLGAKSPGLAKRLGRSVTLRPDWDDVKIETMYRLVHMKFTHNDVLAEKLLATGDEELIEGNTWGDTFWGVDLETGEGENHLGKMLMEIRRDLRRGAGKFEIDPEAKRLEWDI